MFARTGGNARRNLASRWKRCRAKLSATAPELACNENPRCRSASEGAGTACADIAARTKPYHSGRCFKHSECLVSFGCARGRFGVRSRNVQQLETNGNATRQKQGGRVARRK